MYLSLEYPSHREDAIFWLQRCSSREQEEEDRGGGCPDSTTDTSHGGYKCRQHRSIGFVKYSMTNKSRRLIIQTADLVVGRCLTEVPHTPSCAHLLMPASKSESQIITSVNLNRKCQHCFYFQTQFRRILNKTAE